jgi:hypothetical protein
MILHAAALARALVRSALRSSDNVYSASTTTTASAILAQRSPPASVILCGFLVDLKSCVPGFVHVIFHKLK